MSTNSNTPCACVGLKNLLSYEARLGKYKRRVPSIRNVLNCSYNNHYHYSIMKAPDIIYTDGKNTCASAPVFSNIDGNIKYIRADLAELTFDDLEKLDKIKGDVWREGGFKELQETFYAEVIRRFNEYKQNAIEARSGTRKGKGI